MKIFGLVVIAAILALLGNMDYQDEAAEQDRYCEMVSAKNWPSFRDDIDCSIIEGK